MSNKKNKEVVNHESESEEEHDSGSEQDSDVDSEGNYVGEKELQADFEGRNPEDCDFHGIKQLLRQLFLKSNVDLGDLAQIIISQNYVGSVVKQCLDDGMEDDDDDDDGSDGVFGVTTVVNITKRKAVEKWNEIAYKSFLVTALSQTFLICWYGQKLLDSSLGVSHAIYNSGWYMGPRKIKASLIIMLHRSQKQVCVTTYGYSVVSLKSYTKIIKTAWSYFTLLLNIYQQ